MAGLFWLHALQKYSYKAWLARSSSPKMLPACPALYSMAAGVNVAQNAEQPGRAFELAVGAELAQLRRMDDWTAARAANADAILAECRRHAALRVPDLGCNGASCEVDCPGRSGCVHAQYKCYVYVRPERLAEGWSRDRIAADINARGVPVPCYQGSCSEVYIKGLARRCISRVLLGGVSGEGVRQHRLATG